MVKPQICLIKLRYIPEKPVSIFTTTIVDPDMTTKIEEEIRKTGDKQDYKTNSKKTLYN